MKDGGTKGFLQKRKEIEEKYYSVKFFYLHHTMPLYRKLKYRPETIQIYLSPKHTSYFGFNIIVLCYI